jgi:protein-disulfide isomerase
MASLVASILLLLFEFTVLDLIRSEIQTRELGRAVNAYAQNEVVQLALYCDQPLVQIPIRADDPGIGSQASPNTLIVFSDYRCHACREFHDYLEQHLLPQFGDRLRIVFKQRPLLRGSAGASGSDSMQTQSWLAARAASAAARLGGTDAFLRLHRLLFGDSLTLNSERIAGFARQAGVDSRALLRALAAPDHDERIREDIALANRSAGTFVPVIFLNGRRVEHWQSRGFWQRTLSTTDAEPCGDDSRHPQTKSSSSVARTGLATGP